MARIFSLVAILALSSCISLGGGEPQRTTVIVPQGGSTCVNSNGTPCTPQ